jgi:hypothetical protein
MLAASGRLHYFRHFALLACIAAGILAVRWRFGLGAAAWFALYGGLHAAALVASLRVRQPWWRSLLFIAVAAGLAMSIARLGLYGMRYAGKLPGVAGAAALLGTASLLGALAYGGLIRRFRLAKLPIGDLAATSSACAFAALGVLWVVGHSPVRGALWVTIAWWFTFSAGLWYHEPRRN